MPSVEGLLLLQRGGQGKVSLVLRDPEGRSCRLLRLRKAPVLRKGRGEDPELFGTAPSIRRPAGRRGKFQGPWSVSQGAIPGRGQNPCEIGSVGGIFRIEYRASLEFRRRLPLPSRLQVGGEVVVGDGCGGMQGDRPSVQGERFGKIPGLEEDVAQIVECLGVIGIELERRSEFGLPFLKTSRLRQEKAQIVVGLLVARGDPEGLPVFGDGLLVAALPGQKVAEVVVRLRMERIEGDRAPVCLLGRRVIPLLRR